ncbi:MAG TPA: asparaginase [Candidatus Limnocylindria bacterium]|nr:asparaginase [Candidatus Limnocylindria bacterium]
MAAASKPPVLVEVTRGDHVESRHRGWMAVVATDGRLIASLGDPDGFIYLRSSAKPFQLAPFVASGLFDSYGLGDDALAIMAASHSGEDRHVRLVQAILRDAGLTAAALRCGTHAPYDHETARRLARDGEEPTPLRHNCSGKHTGMLLHAKALGAPLDTYWAPDHPVQRAALATVSTVTGVPEREIATATDNCGVVTFGVPLRALALAYARLADPSSLPDTSLGAALARIRDAMMAHPVLVAGERRRLDTALMRAEAGRLLAKGGAEGVQAAAIVGAGSGFALKIEDGDSAQRARNVATCAALHQLGVVSDASLGTLAGYAAPLIRDPRGDVAGEVRPAFNLIR